MKKIVTLLLLVWCAGSLFAQVNKKEVHRSPGKFLDDISQSKGQQVLTLPEVQFPIKDKNSKDVVNTIEIGQSGNAWGFAYNRTTFLWADNDINSVSFIHRMLNPPGTGYLAYDVSTDGGQTWSVNNQVYNPTLDDASNARYPQGLLYNPEGNTDPNEAYFTYFAPTLDASNPSNGGTWGGYCWGAKKLNEGSLPSQTDLPSGDNFYQYLPSGFTLTQLGEAWIVDEENSGETGEYEYTGNLIVGHGLWNEEIENFEYSFEHLELEINPESSINDIKIAFAPDGMTGWICALTYTEDVSEYTWYHPVFFKTTDGGQTWSEEPIDVELGGSDGLEEVRNFISDENLEEFFDPDPVPDRDEIPYYMGYHCDLAVDAWGNPHLMSVVAICDMVDLEWWNYEGVFALFHIYSADQGETWNSFVIDYPKTMDVELTSSTGSTMKMYNRAQVATTNDGAIVFFSFLDTRFEDYTDNIYPDIYFREYIPAIDMHGEEVINVTEWSEAMWTSYYGCMSHYVFSEFTGKGSYDCTIPFVYETLENLDISNPVQFHYISDFQRSYTFTALEDNKPLVSSVQNFPNPFSGVTGFNINLLYKSDVQIEVFDVSGSLVNYKSFSQLNNGPHRLEIDCNQLSQGVYFYNISAGESVFTGKMIIQ